MPELAFEYRERGNQRAAEEISSIYLRGVMLFPKKEEDADEFVRAAFRFGCATSLLDPTSDVRSTASEMMDAADEADSFAQRLADAQLPAVRCSEKADKKKGLHGGIIAGFILTIPLVVAAKRKRLVGRGAAFRVLEMWLSREMRMVGASERNLIKIWQNYQSVAHLWAAHLIFRGIPDDRNEFADFIATAEYARITGENHWPEHAREPLLDPQVTWKLPAGVALKPASYDFSTIRYPESWMDKALEGAIV